MVPVNEIKIYFASFLEQDIPSQNQTSAVKHFKYTKVYNARDLLIVLCLLAARVTSKKQEQFHMNAYQFIRRISSRR